MRDINQWTGVGRLGKQPELKETVNKVPVVDFSIANSRDYKDRDGNEVKRTNWINCRAYKGLAETICTYLDRGSRVGIVGELTVDEWEDKTTGEKKWKTYVLVTELEFLDPKKDSDTASSGSGQPVTQPQYEPYTQPYTPGNYAAIDEDVF